MGSVTMEKDRSLKFVGVNRPRLQSLKQIKDNLDVVVKGLQVMDSTAISLCMDNDLPIMVFNMRKSENIIKAVCGDLSIGTLVTN